MYKFHSSNECFKIRLQLLSNVLEFYSFTLAPQSFCVTDYCMIFLLLNVYQFCWKEANTKNSDGKEVFMCQSADIVALCYGIDLIETSLNQALLNIFLMWHLFLEEPSSQLSTIRKLTTCIIPYWICLKYSRKLVRQLMFQLQISHCLSNQCETGIDRKMWRRVVLNLGVEFDFALG